MLEGGLRWSHQGPGEARAPGQGWFPVRDLGQEFFPLLDLELLLVLDPELDHEDPPGLGSVSVWELGWGWERHLDPGQEEEEDSQEVREEEAPWEVDRQGLVLEVDLVLVLAGRLLVDETYCLLLEAVLDLREEVAEGHLGEAA